MKFSPLSVQDAPELASAQKLQFPSGLVGFPEFTQAEILYQPDQLPFMWLKGVQKNQTSEVSFIVVEPAGLVKDYNLEVSDADVEALGLSAPEDAMILNIAALAKTSAGSKITLNLIGPIVVNRRTLIARQVVIGNAQKYSARYPLFENKA